MMRSGFKLVLLTIPLVGLGAGFLVYTLKTKAPPVQIEQAERTTPVRVITARDGAVTPVVTGHGLVSPARTFEAIAQVGGTVAEINPRLTRGTVLPADSMLLRISDADYTLAVAQAEANIRAAEAKLAELAVSEENQRLALEIETEVLALKAADLERATTLQAGGNIPRTALDAARAGHLAQRQKVQSINSTLALIPTQRAVQQEQIAVSRAALETARLNLGRTELRLPFAARVSDVMVETGRFLRVGEVAATFDGVETAEVEAQVPVTDLRRLLRFAAPDAEAYAADPTAITEVLRGLGLSAEVRLDLGGEVLVWPARVDRVSDKIDAKTATLGVIVTIEGAYAGATPGDHPPLTKGMFVEVAISGPEIAGRVVPRAALAGESLRVVDGENRLEVRKVTPLLVEGEVAVIAEGLAAGERVVVSDTPVAVGGMLLAPVEDDDLAARLEATR
jgi:multidrug efflux pump subunit AcrA (membrane-fusion protein)